MTIQDLKQRKEELGYSYETISILSGVILKKVEELFEENKRTTITYEEKYAIEKVLSTTIEQIKETNIAYMSKKQGEFTIEDYYAIPEDVRVELIDGDIYYMGAPTFNHQNLVMEISYAFKDYAKKNKGRCKVLVSPFNVQLDCDDKTMVQPDVLVVCDENKINKNGIFGAPDLVVEVLSPSTRKKDMSIKLAKYMGAGVREYWLVDSDARRVIVYNWEQEEILNIYGFEDQVPVGIFEGKCVVDFAEVDFTDA